MSFIHNESLNICSTATASTQEQHFK